MRKLLGFLGVFAFTSAAVVSANAAPVPNSRGGDVYRATTISTARMPSMPGGMGGVVSGNLGGNMTANVTACTPGTTQACTNNSGQSGTQTCSTGGTWGGCIISTAYTIDDCMNALLACVNDGGLAGGVADMYDENIRNSIISGMSLCKPVVDRCIADIAVYHSASDVWIDFNSRVVQPQYYNFVLRKTGLTPHQAENTCWLLDKNVYGKSFAAVGEQNEVQGEYAQGIGAYNNAKNGSVQKPNPQGPVVNTQPYDTNRGHYARWDASKAECLVRVAAYNKDDLITNRWLGIGNDKAAEVWKSAGSSFSCNKDLFEFSLMNQTKKMAVLGTTIGAAVGAGTGALIGHAQDKKAATETYCDDEDNLLKMNKELSDNTKRAILNEYMGGPIQPNSPGASSQSAAENGFRISVWLTPGEQIDNAKCKRIQDLYSNYQQWKVLADSIKQDTVRNKIPSELVYCPGGCSTPCEKLWKAGSKIYEETYKFSEGQDFYCDILNQTKSAMEKANEAATEKCSESITKFDQFMKSVNCVQEGGGWKNKVRADGWQSFKNPNTMYSSFNASIYCKTEEKKCIGPEEFKQHIIRLSSVLEFLDIDNEAEEKGMSNAGKGALIGAASGAAAGGLATAITAFVEKNNINCRVGDGLDKVSMGKSGTIETLKNYYIKWALNLPDVVAPTPTAPVNDCAAWTAACATITNISDCITAGIHYLPAGGTTPVLVYNACSVNATTGACGANMPVATSQGACP